MTTVKKTTTPKRKLIAMSALDAEALRVLLEHCEWGKDPACYPLQMDLKMKNGQNGCMEDININSDSSDALQRAMGEASKAFFKEIEKHLAREGFKFAWSPEDD